MNPGLCLKIDPDAEKQVLTNTVSLHNHETTTPTSGSPSWRTPGWPGPATFPPLKPATVFPRAVYSYWLTVFIG